MAVTENKYQLGTAENQKFLQDVRDGLLSFGHQFPSPGGSSYYLGDDGTPWKDRNRETWITSRMTHVYSIGSMLGHEGSEALADAALKGLRGELHDDQNGGWYAGLTKDNEIVPTKQCYAHAFVILAASSGVLACREGAAELLKDALALYDLRFWNEEEGLSCDTWNTEFTPGMRNIVYVQAGSSTMFWYGQRTITGVYRSIFPVTGYRIWNATKTARTTSLSHTAQLRDTELSGQD